MTIDYSRLPEHMQPAAQRYVEHGVHPGSFLTAVICNDLFDAFQRADDVNRDAMFDWCMFFHNDVPGDCYGDYETFKAWLKAGGLDGINAAREQVAT